MISSAEVAVLLPLTRTFTYLVPERYQVVRGSRVWVPLGGRRVEGVVLRVLAGEAGEKCKAIAGVVDAAPLSADQLALAEWVTWYYLAPLGEALRLLLPPGGRASESESVRLTEEGKQAALGLGQALDSAALAGLGLRERVVLEALRDTRRGGLSTRGLARRIEGARLALVKLAERGLIERSSVVKVRQERSKPVAERLLAEPPPGDLPPILNKDQQLAYEQLVAALKQGGHAAFLLHGVTSSGKTEVYLRLIEEALARGQGALALVPEISLTPQLAARFRARFGPQVAVLHSGLSDAERFAAWGQLESGKMRIALGARSAAFAPVARLGVIIIDEEHDASFKQEDGVRYHGRDVALWRARQLGCLAVAGSATPSLELYHAASQGRLGLLTLPLRATPRPLPEVAVVDLKNHMTLPGTLISASLDDALAQTLAAGEQAILLINRRGHSTFILCRACGHRFTCPECSVTLTYHLDTHRLSCHYCGYLEAPPSICPKCAARSIEHLGMGTEKIAAALQVRFPQARVARMDRDTTSGDDLEILLDAMRDREIDVLVGTQMIAKGHDFPGVTLVGVVLADQQMSFPDYRAAERTFQLLEQVAGRAGRGEKAGRVVVQTYNPEHLAVRRMSDHDYLAFCREELASREELGYPPFARLGMVRVDGKDEGLVREVAEKVGAAMQQMLTRLAGQVKILGPAPAPLTRLRGRHRWQLLVKASGVAELRQVLLNALTCECPSGIRLAVDVDPVNVL